MKKWKQVGGFMIEDLRVSLMKGAYRISRQVHRDKNGLYVVIDYNKVYASDIIPMYKFEGENNLK